MQVDFHYYGILFILLSVGVPLKEAKTISYFSQYVDDSREGRRKEILFKDKSVIYFEPIRTAHNGFESLGVEVQEKIYYPFHFVPSLVGDSIDEIFTTKSIKESRFYELFLNHLKESPTPQRLGVLLHPFMDTFSHEGFSGQWSWTNSISSINYIPIDKNHVKNLLNRIKFYTKKPLYINAPPIGHAQAGKFPDLPYLFWKYRKKYEKNSEIKVTNPERFKNSILEVYEFINVYSHYKNYKKLISIDDVLEVSEKIIFTSGGIKERVTLWKRAIYEKFNIEKNISYSEDFIFTNICPSKTFYSSEWISAWSTKEEFFSSDFFKFHKEALLWRKSFYNEFYRLKEKYSLPVYLSTKNQVLSKILIKEI